MFRMKCNDNFLRDEEDFLCKLYSSWFLGKGKDIGGLNIDICFVVNGKYFFNWFEI